MPKLRMPLLPQLLQSVIPETATSGVSFWRQIKEMDDILVLARNVENTRYEGRIFSPSLASRVL